MLKKINLDRLKEFFFNHGEKVALGTCATLALVFGALGIMQASSAARDPKTGLPWADALNQSSSKILTSIQGAPIPKLEEVVAAQLKPDYYKWPPVESSHVQGAYSQTSEPKLDKRVAPLVLPVRSEPEYFHLEYHRGLVLAHEYNLLEGTVKTLGEGGNANKDPVWMKKAEPRRIVIGSAVFPLVDQLRKFRDALRYKTMKELMDVKDDLPKFAGISVYRLEYLKPDSPQPINPDGEILVEYKAKNDIVVAPALTALLKDAIYDAKIAAALEPYLFDGLAMPTPTVANGMFARFSLKGINLVGEDAPAMPEKKKDTSTDMPKKKGGILLPGGKKDTPKEDVKKGAVAMEKLQEANIDRKQLEKDAPQLAKRLFSDPKGTQRVFNIYHILGEFPPEADAKTPAAQPQANQMQAKYFSAWDVKIEKMDKAAPPVAGASPPDYDRDAVVRFIDPNVKPGRTYKYAIQVWIRNPNFNFADPDKVQFAGLMANEDLLPSPTILTPPITIPDDEYGIFAVDQNLLDDLVATGKSDFKVGKDHTTFQIQEWIKSWTDAGLNADLMIGDFVMAERIDVRKGHPIGQNVTVRAPVWKKEKDGFEMFGPKQKGLPSFRMSLTPPAPEGADPNSTLDKPVLVDFTGGKRYSNATGKLDEETAVDALVLMPGGKLKVHNSRQDSDSKERNDRLLLIRNRNNGFLPPPPPPKGGN